MLRCFLNTVNLFIIIKKRLVSKAIVTNYIQIRRLNTVKIYSLTVLDARSPQPRCHQGHTLPETLG